MIIFTFLIKCCSSQVLFAYIGEAFSFFKLLTWVLWEKVTCVQGKELFRQRFQGFIAFLFCICGVLCLLPPLLEQRVGLHLEPAPLIGWQCIVGLRMMLLLCSEMKLQQNSAAFAATKSVAAKCWILQQILYSAVFFFIGIGVVETRCSNLIYSHILKGLFRRVSMWIWSQPFCTVYNAAWISDQLLSDSFTLSSLTVWAISMSLSASKQTDKSRFFFGWFLSMASIKLERVCCVFSFLIRFEFKDVGLNRVRLAH